MRIHPDVLNPKPKWQFPAVLVLLASTVFASAIFSGGNTRAIATQSNKITKLQVVVAKSVLKVGEAIDRESLRLEVRPIESLPEGVFTKFEDVVGKSAAIELRPGTALADFAVARRNQEPVLEVPIEVNNPTEEIPSPPEDSDPQVVPEGPAPRGDTPLVPAKKMPPIVPVKATPLKVTPVKVLPVEVAPVSLAPVEVAPVKEFQPKHEPAPAAARVPERSPRSYSSKAPPAAARKKFSSYAWISGEKVTFGVNRSGKVQIIDQNGFASPLDDYRADENDQ